MPRKVYIELTRFVSQSATHVVLVPDDFDGELDSEQIHDLHAYHNEEGWEWCDDEDPTVIRESAKVLNDTPGDDEEEDIDMADEGGAL
jgi:hypothetical protein